MIRLILALVLLAAAILTLVRPLQVAWLAQVVLTEWGWAFALAALALLLIPGWWESGIGLAAAATAVVAVGIFLQPVLSARRVAGTLRTQMERTFGYIAPPPARGAFGPLRRPFSVRLLVTGIDVPEIEVTTHRYAERSVPLELQLYHPPGPRGSDPLPTVILVHGGSWRGGSPLDVARTARYLASRGYLVAAPAYRLAPEHPWPAAREDLTEVIAWLDGNSAELGLYDGAFALVGFSAGGQLALQVAYTTDLPRIAGVVAFYAPADLRYGWEHPANPRVIDTREVLSGYLGGSLQEQPDAFRDASPIEHLAARLPPTLLIHGGRDALVQPVQSVRLLERLNGAGLPGYLLSLPWATHGCDYNLSGPCGQLSTWALERFLSAMLIEARIFPSPTATGPLPGVAGHP